MPSPLIFGAVDISCADEIGKKGYGKPFAASFGRFGVSLASLASLRANNANNAKNVLPLTGWRSYSLFAAYRLPVVYRLPIAVSNRKGARGSLFSPFIKYPFFHDDFHITPVSYTHLSP